MDNYLVSARKYRPTSFDNVVGQQALTTTLKNAIATGKLAHAYLFCGPRGVGKTTCARIFAKTINCLNPKENGEACGECESCLAFKEGRSYNIHELDAASNNSVEDVRSLIEQVMIPPQVGRYKVFIIDEVHMLSQQAFNAFLKTLEEPPSHAVFILATTEKHKILPTILSRCQIYDFSRMEVGDIIGHLKNVAEAEGVHYEEEALGVIAAKADGGMRDAMSIFDQVVSYSGGDITYKKVIEDLNVLDYDYYFSMTESLLKPDVPAVMLLLNDVISKGFEPGHFINGLAAHFRNLLVSRDAQTLKLLEVGQAVRERYFEQAKTCSPKFLYRALKLCNYCDVHYRESSNKRLLVELMLIEMSQTGGEDDTDCGLGPAKKLKPLFKSEQPIESAATPATKQQSTEKSVNPAQSVVRQAVSNTQSTAKAAIPPKRLTTISIRPHTNESSKEIVQKQNVALPEQPTHKAENAFSQSDLAYQWNCFALALPKEQSAMAGRMKNISPALGSDWVIDVPIENEQVVHYMDGLRQSLTDYLRHNLKNSRITLNYRLVATEDKKRAFSKREILAEMLKKNPDLVHLTQALKLELS